ncbi:MAG: flavodoxin [Lachnospiraceae bacterium]|nr:flavodoxin [Lachnospiraceae bacterium]
MKRLFLIFLSVLLLSGASCDSVKEPESLPAPTEIDSETETENETETETEVLTEEDSQVSSEEPTETETETEPVKKHILVAFFSGSGNTGAVAESVSNALDADLFEIEPEIPYLPEDLIINDYNCRANREQNDPNARPQIRSRVENMEQYDVVLIGFPIWTSEEPRIIRTFLESYNFTGKTLIPFCTSKASGILNAEQNMRSTAPGAVFRSGKRFSEKPEYLEILSWTSHLGLT